MPTRSSLLRVADTDTIAKPWVRGAEIKVVTGKLIRDWLRGRPYGALQTKFPASLMLP
jgi:hypothetical protein